MGKMGIMGLIHEIPITPNIPKSPKKLAEGGVAEAVGSGFALGGCKDDEPDGTDNGNEVDEPPAAALADVVHAAPADCQERYDHCQRNEAAYAEQEVGRGSGCAVENLTVRYIAQPADNEIEEEEPPVFGTRSTTVEVGILPEADLDGVYEAHRGAGGGILIFHSFEI